MKIFVWLLIVYATYTTVRGDFSIGDIEDPVPESNNAGLWNVLYAKLNILLNDTAELSESIAILRQRQDDQENKVAILVHNLMEDANRLMETGLDKLKEKQEIEETRIMNLVQTISTDAKEFMTSGLEELEKRQKLQESHAKDMLQSLSQSAKQSLDDSIMELQKRLTDQEANVRKLMDTLSTDVKKYMDENLTELKEKLYAEEKRVASVVKTFASDAHNSMVQKLEEVKINFQTVEERQLQQHDLSLQILENTQSGSGSGGVPLDSRSLNYHREWTTISRRLDGSVAFDLAWDDYKKGFGHVNGEFFIGLERLHALTTYGGPQELLVVLGDGLNQTRYAKYDVFQVGSEAEEYAIKELGAYSGDAGDSLRAHLGMVFVTKDRNPDNWISVRGGGWWRSQYSMCDLHSYYNPVDGIYGIFWATWNNWQYTLSRAEMMIRSKV
ncbi:fibrinogen-like protein 1 isoform X1 [Stomoxys calcitrans]|uniref:fibrinogen-like protein 1 isoform X1 n=2 Tax=Stomoxys calcitrans TaxID=35570 RepID=UPI0027E2E291|nr:fibrinogen-like protein 1 isoform X1 [Stomoxys calcitrans]